MRLRVFVTAMLLLAFLSPARAAGSKRVLVVISAANKLTLRGAVVHATGFYLNELAVPLKMLIDAGYKPIIATPGGKAPTLDAHSDTPKVFGGDEQRYRMMKAMLAALPGMQAPLRLADVARDGLSSYAAIFVPGGHAPMVDLATDPALGQLLRQAHAMHRPTALICHGPIALLSALPHADRFVKDLADGRTPPTAKDWIYRGYQMTIFSTAEEVKAEQGFLGGRMLFYPDAALSAAGGRVSEGRPFTSHVVVDRELITGQNPFSDAALGDALLKMLHPLHH